MRRYILDMELCSVECESRGIVERSDGEWVKYEDVLLHQRPLPPIEKALLNENARLKELNREMVEALKAECVDCYRGVTERCGDCRIRIVLAKAGGEGE